MLILLLNILLHLAGSLVAFDTTTENYTVPVSGKCVLTCYVTEVRSFKVSSFFFLYSQCLYHHSLPFVYMSIAIRSVGQT